MIGSKWVLAAAAAALMAGCGNTKLESASGDRSSASPSMHHPSSGPDQAGAEWPLPGTGEAVVAAMRRMPQALGTWQQTDVSRGMVFYEHPRGQLGIEGSDLEDLFIGKDVTAEVAVERLAADLDPGTSRSCSRPQYHCVLGESQGQPAMLWSHDDSDALIVAVWPDDESRDLLAEAWAAAQN
jgi:hypothetical protein